MPSLFSLTPETTGVIQKVWFPIVDPAPTGMGPFPATQYTEIFAVQIEGKFYAHVEGQYLFTLAADEESTLYVKDDTVLTTEAPGKSSTGAITLIKGFHTIRITYYQKRGLAGLKLLYLAPDGQEGQVSAAGMYYSP